MAIQSPERAWARASVAPHIRAYMMAPGTRIESTSADPFQSWSCRM